MSLVLVVVCNTVLPFVILCIRNSRVLTAEQGFVEAYGLRLRIAFAVSFVVYIGRIRALSYQPVGKYTAISRYFSRYACNPYAHAYGHNNPLTELRLH